MTRWFDNWSIEMRPYAGKRQKVIWKGAGENGEDVGRYHKTSKPNGRYIVDLPHSFGDKTKSIFFTKSKTDDERIRTLVNIIDSALYTLSKRKWWEFWK